MHNNHSNRFKDVLCALNGAALYKRSLSKLQLQKYIYLAETLSIVWLDISISEGYFTYLRGPYDPSIQNAVDSLSLRGFASALVDKRSQGDMIQVNYQLTDVGRNLINELKQQASFKESFDWFAELATFIEVRGWNNLKSIVYSEPTYVSNRAFSRGTKLITSSLLTNKSLELTELFKSIFGNQAVISKRNLLSLYFNVIDEYRTSSLAKEGEKYFG